MATEFVAVRRIRSRRATAAADRRTSQTSARFPDHHAARPGCTFLAAMTFIGRLVREQSAVRWRFLVAGLYRKDPASWPLITTPHVLSSPSLTSRSTSWPLVRAP